MMIYDNELYHFGTKGQKWGIRKYQNPDGTLTEEGKMRYGNRKTMGIYERNPAAGNLQKKSGAERRVAAEKAVKAFGGKNAAIAETNQAAKTSIFKNRIKAALLGGSTATAGYVALGLATKSMAGALIGSLPGAIIAGGSYFANRAIRRNRDLMKSYISDINVNKKKFDVD